MSVGYTPRLAKHLKTEIMICFTPRPVLPSEGEVFALVVRTKGPVMIKFLHKEFYSPLRENVPSTSGIVAIFLKPMPFS